MVFGTFDVLHPGHIDMFRQARKFGSYLIVVVGRDETVKKFKEYTPKNSFECRLHEVEKNPLVDKARAGYIDDYLRVLEEEKPDMICLGYDQKHVAENLEKKIAERGLSIPITRLKAFKPDKFKSSKLI